MSADPRDPAQAAEDAGAAPVPDDAGAAPVAEDAGAAPIADDAGAARETGVAEAAGVAQASEGDGTAQASAARDATPAPAGAGVSEAELLAMQAAEDAKGDPALDEVPSADIDVADDKDEPFEKLAAAARRLSDARVRTVLQTLLFLAERPLTVDEIRLATGLEPARIAKGLDRLSGEHREGISGIVLHEVAGGWQLRTSPDNAEYARRFLRVKPQRLTRAALETLAIVAYRQPVTRPEIEEIRGVDCGAVVKALLERRLVKILGKKEEPGRPILYGTTKEFLEFFSLKDLASLPTLREFHELSEEHRDIVEKQPEEAPEPIAGLVDELRDDRLRADLEAKRAEGDAALEELERAIGQADERSRAVEAVLDERQQDAPEPDPTP